MYDSKLYELTSGVIPGILGTTTFLFYINDIVDWVDHAMLLLFVDDIKMFMSSRVYKGI